VSVVPDASVVVKWFVREDGHPAALSLLERSGAVVAPDLVFAETANVVWKKLRRGELTLQQANQTCEALPEFFTRVVPTASLIQDALRPGAWTTRSMIASTLPAPKERARSS
jgi:predicted nucleic acid-binding protein